MGTYSDPALILPGSVGQTEVDATLKRNTALGVAGLDANRNINLENLLVGITPTFSGWAVDPGTDAELINELTTALSTPGNQNVPGGKITWDLGVSMRVLITSYTVHSLTVLDVLQVSDDDITYYDKDKHDAGTVSNGLACLAKCRYVRLFCSGASGKLLNNCSVVVYRV